MAKLKIKKTRLAVEGGDPVLPRPLPIFNRIGQEEISAVARVLESGVLSAFLGAAGRQFLGGPMVRRLEEAWCEKFLVRHAISVNSATSGLFAAIGAIGICPGDEVIVPPCTMSATVMAPLVYGGIPIFADIEPETFCIDPGSVRSRIGPRTKAIIAVNLFGHAARLAELKAIARQHRLFLIEDNAQAPLASEEHALSGTVGDIGVFSLNYHKHIHAGEGGVCVTNDDRLAERLQLIRNHGENAVEAMAMEDITNIVGFNYRLTEVGAAIALEQLKKLDVHVERAERIAARLTRLVRGLEGITPPLVRAGCRHVYYDWALRLDEQVLGVTRSQFSRALAAEGFPHSLGYVPPLYWLPVFQQRRAFGSYPFHLSEARYPFGLCPVAERMHRKELLIFSATQYEPDEPTLELMADAIRKVHSHRTELPGGGAVVAPGGDAVLAMADQCGREAPLAARGMMQ
jgi:dTDP-4-amino-4,6-dideoxygalactose transaminase